MLSELGLQDTYGKQCIVGLERGDRGQRDCRGCSLKFTVISLVNSCLIVSVGAGRSRRLGAACTSNHVKLACYLCSAPNDETKAPRHL